MCAPAHDATALLLPGPGGSRLRVPPPPPPVLLPPLSCTTYRGYQCSLADRPRWAMLADGAALAACMKQAFALAMRACMRCRGMDAYDGACCLRVCNACGDGCHVRTHAYMCERVSHLHPCC